MFDKSAKIYTGILVGVTSFFVLVWWGLVFGLWGRMAGVLLVLGFGAYVGSVAWAIWRGMVRAPERDEDSDSDSDSDSDGEEEGKLDDLESNGRVSTRYASRSTRLRPATPQNEEYETVAPTELFDDEEAKPTTKTTRHHVCSLLFGLLLLSLSSYLLSHTLTTLSHLLHLSPTTLSTTLLSLSTTLPEKLLVVFSARRNERGIIIANTVGSNIFLLTLCAGILVLGGDIEELTRRSIGVLELACMWGVSVVLWGIVCWGGRKWMGWGLVVLYGGFLGGEFWYRR